jgi:Zn-dependent peptidase ImmA (M78 family)/transcriptional regulator with XRE-family HTH domain
MSADLIGARIKAKREELNFSQEAVSRLLGFKDRQTLSAIETGERRVSADELLRFAEVLAAPLEYFTDPFSLAGEARFSWRLKGGASDRLDAIAYELMAGPMIGLFRSLSRDMDRHGPLLRPSLPLTKTSSFDEATAAGERFATEFQLGDAPAHRLADTMQGKLGILVLMVDPVSVVSGAACRLPELDAVLINRGEVPGRRHFDLAHELFHILTWEAMPPERFEEEVPVRKSRVEQLADSFASALLMPKSALDAFGDWAPLEGPALAERLNLAADRLGVTSVALLWRLIGAKLLPRTAERTIEKARLNNNGRPRPAAGPLPPLFSRPFAELVAGAISAGRISTRRAARVLGLPVDDLAEAFAAHGVDFDPDI